MAVASFSEDEFMCSLCRILLNDPVTLPCGHTYCMRCITASWNQEDQTKIYSCPQCRQTFSPRPVLGKNELVAKMVEKFKAGQPQERICPRHHKVMEIYCIQCQRCICMLCLEDEHRNHDTASISAANKEKRRRERDLQKLQQEIDDLKRRKVELEKISQTQDHIQFLQSLQCLSVSGSTQNISVTSDFDDVVVKSVSQCRDKLLQYCREEFHKISVTSILVPEPQSRMEILQYNRQFTLDPNTVNCNLSLSEENRMATITVSLQQYPDHPDRFDHWMNMMCTESVSGRCYWEVEWSGQGRLGVDVAVAYKSISRKGVGLESAAGRNDQSWNLFCSPIYCSFIHNNSEMVVSLHPSSSRVGVYVDHSAGILSFYSVSSDTMSLIHRVHTTFTQPLYPMFGLDEHCAFRLVV